MKYGVYRDQKHHTDLWLTTVDEATAVKAADACAIQLGGSFSVVVLGPQTPNQILYTDRFAPKMIYKARRL